MNEDLLEYRQQLEAKTEEFSSSEPIRSIAFTKYILSEIAEKVNVLDYEIANGKITNKAGNIIGELYAYAESSNQEVLSLFYAVYDSKNDKEIKTLSDSDLQKYWNRLQGFYNASIRGAYYDMSKNSPLYEAAKAIYENHNAYVTIRMYILSNCAVSKSTPKKIRIADEKEVFTDVWDIKKIKGNLFNGSDHVSIDIDFENDPDYRYKIPYIEMDSKGCNYKCFLAMFPGKLLYKLYKRYNTDLLMNNVRFFLGFKSTKTKTTNKDMKDTLTNEAQKFLALNNGITAIARNVNLDDPWSNTDVGVKDENGQPTSDMISTGMFKSITDFQIVNGGQTTAAIFFTKKNDPSVNLNEVFVQVKLIVLPPSKDEDGDISKMAERITLSSNNQNKIKYADFSVSNAFNMGLQKLSRTIKIPNANNDVIYWFYERVRGQYENEYNKNTTKASQQEFTDKYPKSLRFKKEELAIVQKSWKQEPYDAVKGAGTAYDSFISATVKDDYLPDEYYYKTSIALLIMYKFLKGRPEGRTYGNKKASVIAYTIAYVNYITFGNFNLIEVWNHQDLSENQKKALNILSDSIKDALTDLAGETGVLSYGKRKGAFEDLKNHPLNCDIAEIKELLRN